MRRSLIFFIIIMLCMSIAWTEDWNPITPPGAPSARQGHSMVTLPDGRVMLFGGEDAQADLFNDLYAFDTNTWNVITPHNSPPPARRDHQAWMRPDAMYIYGGYGDDGALDDMWCYDPIDSTWQQVQITGPAPMARYGHTAAALADGSVIMFGGTDAEGNALEDCWKLNENNTFVQLTNSNYPYKEACAELIADDQLMLVFGIPGIISLYQFSAGMWGSVSGGPPISGFANSSQGVNAVGDPLIFIFGGKDAMGNENSEVYEYNFNTGETTLRDPMPQPIVNGASAQLPVIPPGIKHSKQRKRAGISTRPEYNRNWLVFGGLTDSIPTNNTYTFTPISPPDTIAVVAPLDSVFADSVLMRWYPSEPWHATHYQLQVASDSAMTIFLADTVLTDTTYLVKELINNTDYWWHVRGYNAGGWGPFNTPAHFFVTYVVSVDDDTDQNNALCLTVSPNPFQDHISISFSLSQLEQVTCTLYNIRGERIDIMISEQCPSGINIKEYDMQDLKSGVYFLKLRTQKTEEIQKIIHL